MIHLALSTDNNYIKQCYTLITSALLHSSEQINFHIIVRDVTQENRDKIETLIIESKNIVTFYDFKLIEQSLNTDNSFNLSAYGRLFLPKLLDTNISKILYCDSDGVFLDDPALIYNIELKKDMLCGGVLDVIRPKYKGKIGFTSKDQYINSGLILLDLESMRSENTLAKFLECINEYNGSVPHNDQGVINKVFKGRIQFIPPKCNVLCPMFQFNSRQFKSLTGAPYYSNTELNYARNNPIYVHYTEDYYNRPWCEPCTHPLKNEYLKLYMSIPFKITFDRCEQTRNVKFLKFMALHFPDIYILIFKFLDSRSK